MLSKAASSTILRLSYDSTLDWTLDCQTLGEHSSYKVNSLVKQITQSKGNRFVRLFPSHLRKKKYVKDLYK